MEPSTHPAAVAETPPPPSTEGPPLEERVELLTLDRLRPSPYNPRIFPPKPSRELIDLAKSIRRIDLVQPITVRPLRAKLVVTAHEGDVRHGDMAGAVSSVEQGDIIGYEIVAGERRYRASKMRKGDKHLSKEDGEALDAAGPAPTHIKVIIRELTDQEAMEVTTVENLDREDLQPLEEANGVATLMQLYVGDVEAVAARLNRPLSWVAMRNRLTKLSKRWRKEIIDTDSGFHVWTTAHLAEIARLDPVAQDELLEQFHSPAGMTVGQVRGIVANEVRTLGGAPFDILDEALVPKCGGCATCPKTSAAAPGLFEDFGDEVRPSELRKARCLDPICWDAKTMAAVRSKVKELRQQHGDAAIIFESYGDQHQLPQDLQQKARHVHPHYGEFQKAEPNSKGAWPGLYATGPRAGQIEWYKKRSERSASSATGKAAKGDDKPTPLAERRLKLERRRRVLAVEKIAKAVKDATKVPEPEILLRLAITFGTQEKRDAPWSWTGEREDPWKSFDSGKDDPLEDLGFLLWQRQLQPVLLNRLTYQGSSTDIKKLFMNASRLAELVDVDALQLYEDAVKEITEPKSWASLKEDGTPKASGVADKIKQAVKKGPADGKSQGKTAGPAAAAPVKGRRPSSSTDRKAVRSGAVAAKPSTSTGKAAAARGRKASSVRGARP